MSTSETPRWGAEREMNELEATMWRAEVHPVNSTQGGILRIFGDTPDWEAVKQSHLRAIARVPRLRQRVVEPAIPVGSPTWVEARDLDLSYHLRRVRLPEPGTQEQLLELAQTLGSTALDKRRPLWNATFIEGLEGGRSAHFTTIHHCMMDGHASIQLLSALHAGPKDEIAGLPVPASGPGPSPVQLAAEQAVARVTALPRFGGRLARGAAGVLRTGPGDSLRFLGSIGRVIAPPPASSSRLMADPTRSAWRYLTFEVPFKDLKAASRALDGTINDAYVAAVLGGIRRAHEELGEVVGDITVSMPVSVRNPDDPEGGNRFVAAFLPGPAGEPDPQQRVRKLQTTIRAIRQEPALDFFSILLPALNRIPASVLTPIFTAMQNRADLTISNVPGLREPVTFSGAPVDAMYYFGPLPGGPLMVVLCSHVDTAYIGVTYDGHVFEDGALLRRCLQQGLDEVLATAGDAPQKERTHVPA